MDRIGAGAFGCVDDPVAKKVAFANRCGTDVYRLISQFHVHRVAVCIGKNSNRFDAQFTRGADDAAGDFASVCNQDFLDHAHPHHIRNRPKRVSSIGAFSVVDSDSPRTSRVLVGSMMPSSHRRAEA